MSRKLAIFVLALLLLTSSVVVWSGLNRPSPEWLRGPGDFREERPFRSTRIPWSATDESVLWSPAPTDRGGAAVASSRNTRPPRGVAAALHGESLVEVRSGNVLGRLCHPIGLRWGRPSGIMNVLW